MDETTSIVPRETFSQEVLQEASRSPYVPSSHNGKLNPYTGRKITNEQEYYEYQREYVYHRLCDKILRIQYEQKLITQIEHFTSTYEDEIHVRKVFSRVRFLALLFVLIFVLFLYLPRQKNLAFEEGQSNGYTSGYDNGYKEGEAAGAARNDRSSTSSSGRLQSKHNTTTSSNISPDQTVYVSQSGHKIHLKSNCSGMIYYDTMTYIEATTAGYSRCSKCF